MAVALVTIFVGGLRSHADAYAHELVNAPVSTVPTDVPLAVAVAGAGAAATMDGAGRGRRALAAVVAGADAIGVALGVPEDDESAP